MKSSVLGATGRLASLRVWTRAVKASVLCSVAQLGKVAFVKWLIHNLKQNYDILIRHWPSAVLNPKKMEFRNLRMEACQRCPLFDSNLLTCGTPCQTWEPEPGTQEQLGCGCPMNVASFHPGKDCWLAVYELEIDGYTGWPDNLRPSPIDL